MRWRCSQRAHLGMESYACMKSINAACNLGKPWGFLFAQHVANVWGWTWAGECSCLDRNQIACQVSYCSSVRNVLTPLRHVYSQNIHIQSVHCSAHSQHAIVVCVQHNTSFIQWCHFGCLPHLRDLSFFHHQGKEAGKVGCQHVHLFNTTSRDSTSPGVPHASFRHPGSPVTTSMLSCSIDDITDPLRAENMHQMWISLCLLNCVPPKLPMSRSCDELCFEHQYLRTPL